MSRIRIVMGKVPDLKFRVTENALPSGGFRTRSIEGQIRYCPGRGPHSGNFRSNFDHYGHLIADQFGGPGDAASGNIVAMHGHANNGAGGQYKRMEDDVKRLLFDREAFMKVDVGYKATADLRPHVFEVFVRFANGMHSCWRIFNFYPGIPNPALAKR